MASLASSNPCNLTFVFPDKLVNKDTLALEAVNPGDTVYFSVFMNLSQVKHRRFSLNHNMIRKMLMMKS